MFSYKASFRKAPRVVPGKVRDGTNDRREDRQPKESGCDMAYIDRAKTSVWETPQALFDELNAEHHFTLDPCATPENAKCEHYFTEQDDGLSKNWGGRACSAIRRMALSFAGG